MFDKNLAIQSTNQIINTLCTTKQAFEDICWHVDDVLCVFDPSGAAIRANPSTRRFLRIHRSESLFDLFTPNIQCEFKSIIEHIQSGETLSGEFEAAIRLVGTQGLPHQWRIGLFCRDSLSGECLFFARGQNISALKAYERKVALAEKLRTLYLAQQQLLKSESLEEIFMVFIASIKKELNFESLETIRFIPDRSIASTMLELVEEGNLRDTPEHIPMPPDYYKPESNHPVIYNQFLYVPLGEQALIEIGRLHEMMTMSEELKRFISILTSCSTSTLDNLRQRSIVKVQNRSEQELKAVQGIRHQLMSTKAPNSPLLATPIKEAQHQTPKDWFAFHEDELGNLVAYYSDLHYDGLKGGMLSCFLTGVCQALFHQFANDPYSTSHEAQKDALQQLQLLGQAKFDIVHKIPILSVLISMEEHTISIITNHRDHVFYKGHDKEEMQVMSHDVKQHPFHPGDSLFITPSSFLRPKERTHTETDIIHTLKELSQLPQAKKPLSQKNLTITTRKTDDISAHLNPLVSGLHIHWRHEVRP